MKKTVGQRLKEAREYRNFSLEKVAADTHIRLPFLQALEADDFSVMPSPIQARGFLRNYAQYLGLDLEEIVAELHREDLQPIATSEVIFEQNLAQEKSEEVESEPIEFADEEQHTLVPFWKKWLKGFSGRLDPQEKPKERQGQEEVVPQAGAASENLVDKIPSKKIARSKKKEETSKPNGHSVVDTQEDHDTPPSEDTHTQRSSRANMNADREESEAVGADGSNISIWASVLDWLQARFSRLLNLLKQNTQVTLEEEPVLQAEQDLPENNRPSAQAILDEIGMQLRERREMLSLSLEEIERHTRMRAHYLKALESGDFEKLPSTVQTRGMLNNYASFLDLDVDTILLRFADALQARHRERYPEKPSGPKAQPVFPGTVPHLRRFIAGDLVFGLGMLLILIIFTIWGISRVVAIRSQQDNLVAEATSPSISEALIGTPVEAVQTEVTLIPAADTPLPVVLEGTQDLALPSENVVVQINIVVVERTYLRVHVDGEVAFDGRVLPGNAYPFEAEQSIEILAGNAAALRVTYNQRDLGLLGGFGELVNYVFNAEEISTPTPESSTTPTFTPPETPTPSGTPTPSPTLPAEEGAF